MAKQNWGPVNRKASLAERFHTRYEIMSNGCWEWRGTLTARRTGYYGLIVEKKERLLAHRVSYAIHKGDPTGKCVLHKCDNRKCVNPEHLFLGTRAENNKDRDIKMRGPRGERNWCTKLKSEDIPIIRRLNKEGFGQLEIARRFGVSQGAISNIVNSHTWTHIP